jgi:hypothetical protein
VAVGERCSFDVTEAPRQGGGSWCHTEIRCGEKVIYGGESRGFFDCATNGRSVRGRDDRTTQDDGDASLLLDLDGRTVTVADDATSPLGAFGLEARITTVE